MMGKEWRLICRRELEFDVLQLDDVGDISVSSSAPSLSDGMLSACGLDVVAQAGKETHRRNDVMGLLRA